jgi:hypothetical protein
LTCASSEGATTTVLLTVIAREVEDEPCAFVTVNVAVKVPVEP